MVSNAFGRGPISDRSSVFLVRVYIPLDLRVRCWSDVQEYQADVAMMKQMKERILSMCVQHPVEPASIQKCQEFIDNTARHEQCLAEIMMCPECIAIQTIYPPVSQ